MLVTSLVLVCHIDWKGWIIVVTSFLGYLQSSVGQGRRSSSAVAYLDPLVSSGSRPNLSVLINTVVTKLYHTNSLDGTPEFKTIELGQVNSSQYLVHENMALY